jgi:hypothetical protein
VQECLHIVKWGVQHVGIEPPRAPGYYNNPSGRIMTLGFTQSLTEMSTRNNSWGKGGRCVGLTTLPPSCVDYLEMWDSQPAGTLKVCPGL